MRKKHTDPLQCGQFYHIYNRGINGQNIFIEACNYRWFLKKYKSFIEPVAETYAYALLGNHFHFLIRTRSSDIILHHLKEKRIRARVIGEKSGRLSNSQLEREVGRLISAEFANFFNSYTQSFNKVYLRTGGLFEEPFRRVMVQDQQNLKNVVRYIHLNPVYHGFADGLLEYPHTSYEAFFSDYRTNLQRNVVLNWFGGKDQFKIFHQQKEAHLLGFDSFDIEII